MEKEIKAKYGMNLLLQQFLIKVIRSTQHFMDTLIHKFDELLLIFEETLGILKKLAPTIEAYDNLTKVINVKFQKVFRKVW